MSDAGAQRLDGQHDIGGNRDEPGDVGQLRGQLGRDLVAVVQRIAQAGDLVRLHPPALALDADPALLLELQARLRVGDLALHVLGIALEPPLQVLECLDRLVEREMDPADLMEQLGVVLGHRQALVQRLELTLALGVADFLDRHVAALAAVHESADVLPGVPVDQDPLGRAELLQARGQVHHVADRGVGLALVADESRDRGAGGDADPHVPGIVQAGQLLLHLERGHHRHQRPHDSTRSVSPRR